MSALSRWLLIPPVSARLSERYQGYRRHGASPFSAALGCLWTILAWIVFPLEHPRWQRIRDGHKALYPHINAARPPAPAGPGPLPHSDPLAGDDLVG